MKVCIVEGYKPDDQISMDLYAHKLREARRSTGGDFHVSGITADISFPTINSKAFRNLIGVSDRFLRYPWKLLQLVKRVEVDVFHIADHINSYLISYLPQKRTIVTCHDLIPLMVRDGKFNGVSKTAAGNIQYYKYCISGVKKARYVIVDSENTKKDLLVYNLCPIGKIRVIYPGLNFGYQPMSTENRMRLRTKYGVEDKFTLLHVGSSLFYKNIETIIRSMKILCEKNANNRFMFIKAGQPFSRKQRTLIEKYGLENSTRYIGAPKDFCAMQKVYNLADVFVFPSLYEGFGWPPLEAMACGIPVVCSNRGSLGEIVQSAAIICDPDDPQTLAESVRLLRDDEVIKAALIRKGFEHSTKFKWEKTANKVAELYQNVWDQP